MTLNCDLLLVTMPSVAHITIVLKYMIMIRQRSDENFVAPSDTDGNRTSSGEYFAPLVDQSNGNSYHIRVRNHHHGHQTDQSSWSPRRIRGPIDDEHFYPPNPPLQFSVTPANPQSPIDEQQQQEQEQYYSSNYHHQQEEPEQLGEHQSTLVFTAKRKSTFSFAVTAFCILGFCLYSNSRLSLRKTVREVNDLVAFSEKLHRQLRQADHDMRFLGRELAALDAIDQKREDEEIEELVLSQSSAFANPDLINEINSVQRKLKISQTQADKLKTKVSVLSKQDAIQMYGSGTIRIRMDLIFFDNGISERSNTDTNNNNEDEGPHIIIMEMASLDLMPHSVFTFLEMISNQLLDGCSFVLNALHVLKAAPLPYDGTSASRKARQFIDHGLESVAFREYSPAFPHERYTVGFAADGSPSFYINIEDNSDIHVGDPCFARVVSGFDTIERLENVPTRNGIWFEHRIGIKQVTIL